MTSQEPYKKVTAKICPSCSREFEATGDLSLCPHDQTLLSLITDDPFIGKVIAGHYVVTDVLGQGGWSIVYRAQHQTIKNRQVAIKVLHSHLVRDKDKVLRFQREAEAAMSLKHPHVAAVFDYGILNEGQPFIVMEYLEGKSLEEVLQAEGKLAPERILRLAKQACEGLAGAHENRVVHRDVKPSNIFLVKDASGDEFVKVLDFGLAKILTTDQSLPNLTQTGDTMGTPDYMSPEQCLGLALDERSDIYNLGYVLYEMFTGRKAVCGSNTFEAMNLHIYDSAIPFKEVDPKCQISVGLEAVVFKALAKNPDDRYQTILELRDALEKAAAEKEQAVASFQRLLSSVKRKRIASASRASKQAPPNFLMASLSIAVVLLVVASVFKIADVLNGQQRTAAMHAATNAAGVWTTLNAQGINAYNEGDFKVARTTFEQAEKIGAQIGEESEQHRVSLTYLKDTYGKLGDTNAAAQIDGKLAMIEKNTYYKELGRKDENDAQIRKLFRQLLSHPKDKKIATELSAVLNNQSALAISDGRKEESRELVDQAMDVSSRILGKEHPEYAKGLSNLGAITFDSGKREEAEALYKMALELREKSLGKDDPLVGRSCRNLAEYYRRTGRTTESIPLLLRALDIYGRTYGKESADYAFTANNLGIAYVTQGKLDEADLWLNTALRIRAKIDGVDSADYGRVVCNLGNVNCLRKNYTMAEQQIKQAMEIFERKLGPNKAEYGLIALNLGEVYANTDRLSLAEKYFKRAFSVLHSVEPRSDRTVGAFQALCALYSKEHKIEEARALTRKVGELSAKDIEAADAARPIDMR